jgi:hypothetical protein
MIGESPLLKCPRDSARKSQRKSRRMTQRRFSWTHRRKEKVKRRTKLKHKNEQSKKCYLSEESNMILERPSLNLNKALFSADPTQRNLSNLKNSKMEMTRQIAVSSSQTTMESSRRTMSSIRSQGRPSNSS